MRTPPQPGRILAFRVVWEKWRGIVSIVAGRSKGKALWATVRAIRDIGYKPGFFEMRARRAPEFDSWAAQLAPERIGKGVSEETAKNERQAFLERLKRLHGPGSPEA